MSITRHGEDQRRVRVVGGRDCLGRRRQRCGRELERVHRADQARRQIGAGRIGERLAVRDRMADQPGAEAGESDGSQAETYLDCSPVLGLEDLQQR